LRRQRHTGEQIAAEVGVSQAARPHRLSALEPAAPVRCGNDRERGSAPRAA